MKRRIDQPGIRSLATVVAIAAAVRGLQDVVAAVDPAEVLRTLLRELS